MRRAVSGGPSQLDRSAALVPRLALGLCLSLLPNSDGRVWQDVRYEACMATAGQDDWQCELSAYGDPI